MATETRAAKGFKVPCPRCGEEGVTVNLADLNEFKCGSCEEEFSADDVRALVAGWTKVLAWIDAAPDYPTEE